MVRGLAFWIYELRKISLCNRTVSLLLRDQLPFFFQGLENLGQERWPDIQG